MGGEGRGRGKLLRTGPQEALEAGASVNSFCARLRVPHPTPGAGVVFTQLGRVETRKLCPGASVKSPGGQEGLGGDADGTDRDSSWHHSVPSAWNCLPGVDSVNSLSSSPFRS